MTDVRELSTDDLDWVVESTRRRREALAAHAPRFWKPAPDAAERHRAFLAHLISDPATLALRTEHGFLIAVAGERRRIVDDMAVDGPAWDDEGVALLRAVVGTGSAVRFVAPVSEPERRSAAETVGLHLVESWWHRDLPVVQVRGDSDGVQLSTDGATGRLVPAPPIYDPGGPVLLVTGPLGSAGALGAIEVEAAERGATVSVVSQPADDLMRELLLVEAGYRLTTHFFEG